MNVEEFPTPWQRKALWSALTAVALVTIGSIGIGLVWLVLEEPVRNRARVLMWKIRSNLHRNHCCFEDLPEFGFQGMSLRPLSHGLAYG